MYSPIPPTQFPPYPMSYSQSSPLYNLNYNYAALYPPYSGGAYTGFAGGPMQGYGLASTGMMLPPQGYGQIPQPIPQISPQQLPKTQQQLIQNIRDPSKNHPDFDINKTAILGTGGTQLHGYSSQRSLNIQQGYSQFQYIPYQSYYVDYQPRQFIQNIRVPIEKKVKDYYAVEHIVDYVPKEIQETVVEMVPQEKMMEKLYYVPVEKQVVHLPQEDKVHVHKPTTTTVITQKPTVHVVEQAQQVITRPVQQVQIPTRVQISNQVQIPIPQSVVQQQQIIRSPSPQPVRVQTRPSPPKVVTQQIVQPQPVPISQPKPVVVGEVPRPAGGQFIQNANVLQVNQMQMQKQMNIPDSAKVNYQYSTRTQRKLTPQQIAQRRLQARVINQPQPQIISQQTAQRQPQLITQPQPIIQPQPRLVPQPQPQPQSLLRPSQPSTDLMKNRQVDLADSEHIDITKSTFNKFYGTSGPTSSLAPQGSLAPIANKNSSAFSFAGEQSLGGSADIGVNRVSGGADIAGNRVSGGSVFDYDLNRGDY